MELSRILSNQTGSGKSKMATYKLEIPISRLVDEIEAKFQRLSPVFQGPAIQRKTLNIVRPNRKWKIQDRGFQNRNYLIIVRLVDEIKTKSQRLNLHFRDEAIQGD